MITLRSFAAAALLAAMLGATACSGAAPVTGTALQGQGANNSARSAYLAINGDAQITTLGELQMYRCQFDGVNKAWVVFYYSPSKNESYRCSIGTDNRVAVVKLMDPIQAYKPSYQIDRDKWKIDSEQAKTLAVQQSTTINVNVSVNSFTAAGLISPLECKEQTGKDTSDPVWLLIANNINVYINANTGAQIQTGVATPPPNTLPTTMPAVIPSAIATMIPSAIPSVTPTLAPSTMPSVSASMVPVPSPGTQVLLRATLTGAGQVPSVSTSWTGQVMCTLNADRTAAQIDGTFTSGGAAATGAHIHKGAAGVNGPVVHNLTLTGNAFAGTWSTGSPALAMSRDMVDALLKGELYVNIHSAAHPDGEIRGQLIISNN